MVIVQLFAADQDTPRDNIGCSIITFEVSVAAVVTEPVDDTCRKERHRQHLDGNDDDPGNAEQQQIRENN